MEAAPLLSQNEFCPRRGVCDRCPDACAGCYVVCVGDCLWYAESCRERCKTHVTFSRVGWALLAVLILATVAAVAYICVRV